MTTLTEDRMLERLQKMLAQAEGTTNESERDAFMERAQELSTLYSISLATARAAAENKAKSSKPTNKRVKIGEPRKHSNASYCNLLIAIAGANNLKVTIAYDSTFMHLYGFPEDIELAERLYASLLMQMVEACEKYLETGTYKQERVYREVTRSELYRNWRGETVLDRNGEPKREYFTEWEYAPVTRQAARYDFQDGFASHIGARLRAAQKKAEKTAVEEDVATPSNLGAELVLVEKKKAVSDYYNAHNNARGSWQGGRGNTSDRAWSSGRDSAASAKLSSPSEFNGARKAIG